MCFVRDENKPESCMKADRIDTDLDNRVRAGGDKTDLDSCVRAGGDDVFARATELDVVDPIRVVLHALGKRKVIHRRRDREDR